MPRRPVLLLAARIALLALLACTPLLPPARADEGSFAAFAPHLAKEDWWVLRVDRDVALSPSAADTVKDSYSLLYYVVDVQGTNATLLVTSTWSWSYLVLVDLATFQPRKVVPSCFTLDYANERLSITTEKTVYDLDARPSLAVFPEYHVLDFLFFGFPAADATLGKAFAITEAEGKGEAVAVRTAPLTQNTEVKDGALHAAFEADLQGKKLRLVTVWKPGLPFFARAEFENPAARSHGTARLVAAGAKGREVFMPAAHGYYSTAIGGRDREVPAFRGRMVDFFAQPAVDAAVQELRAGVAAGADDRPFDCPGENYFRRGDSLRVYWHLRHIPAVTTGSGPGPAPEAPKNKVAIPNYGYFNLRVQDLRRVGAEDLVFLVAPGEDSKDYSYRTRTYADSRSGVDPLWSLLSGQGASYFVNPTWWRASADKRTWEWWRVRSLRALTPVRTVAPAAASEEAKYARPPTWWVIVLRRADLSLRALFGYTLDDGLSPRPFDVKLVSAPDAPIYVAQGLQLLRPQDWLLVGGWVALARPPAAGTLLQLSQTNPGQFRAQFEPATQVTQAEIRNDDFFNDLRALLDKKDKDAEKRRKRGEKKQAQALITAQEVERLEKGPGSDTPEVALRKLEEGAPALKAMVLRVGFGREVATYLGYDWGYPYWKEAAVINFRDSYFATLNLLVPAGHARGT